MNGVAFYTSEDKFTDRIGTRISIDELGEGGAYSRKAELTMVCNWLGEVELFFVIFEPLEDYDDEEVQVTYRLDEATQIVEKWRIGDLVQIATYLSPSESSAFYDDLRDVETLLIRLRIRDRGAQTFTFDVSDFFNTPAQGNIDQCGP